MEKESVPFNTLLGKTLKEVIVTKAPDKIQFHTTDDDIYLMCHDQDCCEDVHIESIVGDTSDLLDNPLLIAEESNNHFENQEHDESITWTFYKLATIKGFVDIRWVGSSNGYYSESVELYKVCLG